jgi:hypothetical protein
MNLTAYQGYGMFIIKRVHNFILRNFNSLIIRRLYVWHKIWILQRLRDRRKQRKEK